MSRKTAPAKTSANKVLEKEEQYMYIGPGFRGIAHGQLYIGDIPQYMKDNIAKLPAIGGLIIPSSQFAEASKKLQDKDSNLAMLCRYVEHAKRGD